MDNLRRSSAPLSDRVWTLLDEAAAQAARHVLAARRIATFDGPHGWDHAAVRLGTMTPCRSAEGQAVVCVPEVVLLAEIRGDFTLPWTTVDAFEHGAPALDTEPAETAAREVALAEDRLALYGDPTGGPGFLTAKDSPHVAVREWNRPGQQLVADLLRAVELLDGLGVPGPYEAVLSTARYYAYLRAVDENGYPTVRHLKEVLAGVHRASVLREAGAVFSTRGGDFVLSVGGDLATGYRWHDRENIHLFCAETVAAQVLTPAAVCRLVSA